MPSPSRLKRKRLFIEIKKEFASLTAKVTPDKARAKGFTSLSAIRKLNADHLINAKLGISKSKAAVFELTKCYTNNSIGLKVRIKSIAK